ncbi:hypothetical protein DXB18_15440 [Clostridium sp. OM02-18AC]|uniref:nucleotidyltransferase substrate binding protein n=1 Tax=Clostridium sp. OM02-18AC TaxID=2292311 RepID=UPI000E51051C|nr:nucleotidyltransferase substrate binding protein [Clostridium sp. OM02-18AC]RHV62701.1 hypothetical protein DXB18_15440 [Clostridium sp. OM02-18AC]
MENKSINRYNTFCKSLKNLEKNLIDDDTWMQMLKTRNQLAHDYDGSFAAEKFRDIIDMYYPLFLRFQKVAETYLQAS